MKAIFALVFVFLIQVCLNSSDKSINIPENNGLAEQECNQNHWGFGFYAVTSGLADGFEFSINLGAPRYSTIDCSITVPEEEGSLSAFSCWANGEIYPLLDKVNDVALPETFSYPGIEIVGWNYLRKQLQFGFCSKLIPTSTFISNKPFTNNGCDGNDNNVLTTTGSFSSSLQGQKTFLTSTEETYQFEPVLKVDVELAKAYCELYVANGGDDELKCVVNGKKTGVFFDTAATLKVLEGTDPEVIRLKLNEEFNFKTCKSYFMKLSGLLLISLFLL